MLYLGHIPVLAILGDRVSRILGHVPLDAQDSWWNNRLYVPDVGPEGMRLRFLVTLAVLLPANLFSCLRNWDKGVGRAECKGW